MSREERDARIREQRRRGIPTLPLSAELAGLDEDAQAELISAAARRCVEWWGEHGPATADAERRRLLMQRQRSEVTRAGVAQQAAVDAPMPGCPWCGRRCLVNSPACREHDELERGFLQAAGDGWG